MVNEIEKKWTRFIDQHPSNEKKIQARYINTPHIIGEAHYFNINDNHGGMVGYEWSYVDECEQVNHPKHYGGSENTYEAIKVIEAWDLDFCLGNTIKYISRAGKKETGKTIQDLEKAEWYLKRKIEQLKSLNHGKTKTTTGA